MGRRTPSPPSGGPRAAPAGDLPYHPSGNVFPLLKEVSRSFYLSLRVLPKPVRDPISMGYLLARTTDTIADTAIVPVEERLAALRDVKAAIGDAATGRARRAPDVSRFAEADQSGGSAGEQRIIRNIAQILDGFARMAAADRSAVGDVLATIVSGQEFDLIRFGSVQSGDPPVALACDAELDRYTYAVAGCVGEFWTKLCRAHLFPRHPVDEEFLFASARNFGEGLQLVNILRDLPADLRQGRCYIPGEALARQGLVPEQLLDPASMESFRPVYHRYLQKAEDDLVRGWAYTRALPRGQVRVRLACAWPVLIGIKTTARLRTANVLDPGKRVKLSRSEVREIVWKSVVLYPRSKSWDTLLDSLRANT